MTSSVRYHCLWLALLMSFTGTGIAAEEDLLLSFGDEDFVSIATGQQQAISEAPAVATVITASEIAAMGAANLDEVLATVPGLHVALSSYRFSPIYSMRGIHNDRNPQVLMLVNGTPITQLYFGDRGAKNTLPVSNIARVEVIRGPGSAIYGADAFAGVINVITKTSTQIGGTHLGARVGSFDTRELWLLNGSKLGEVELAFSINLFDTSGDSGRIIDADAQTTFDSEIAPLTGLAVSLAPSQAATDEERADFRVDMSWRHWKFSVWNWRQQGGVGPGLALALDPDGESEANNYLFDLGYVNRDSFKNWEYEARLSYMDINTRSRQSLFPAGALIPLTSEGNVRVDVDKENPGRLGLFTEGMLGNPEIYEEHTRFDSSAFFNGFNRHSIRIAAGVSYAELRGEETKNYGPPALLEEGDDGSGALRIEIVGGELTSVTGTAYNFITDESRTVYYASLQDEWAVAADWNLTLGVRYDHYSDFGSTVNPRAALVWNTRQDLTTKFLYGRAFRAPSFAELFVVNNPVSLGDPDLDPETINTFEVAFDYRPTFDLRTGLNIYYYRIDDSIQYGTFRGSNDEVARQAENAGGQTGYGFELEASWRIAPSLSLQTYYALQRSRFDGDENDNEDVANAPQHQLYADLHWNFAYEWELSGQAKWVSGRKREPGDPRAEIDDYTLTSLVLRRTNIINHMDISLVVNNVFDVEPYEPSPGASDIPGGSLVPGDFPLAGRAFYAKIGYQF